MCGIAGIVARGTVEEADLSAMATALAHRGPDGEGIVRFAAFQAAGETWQVGLAHRRLAVFDPTPAGAQPMRSRSGRTWIVLNGEIYNHQELRRYLGGFTFRTGTDTEVLLELIEAIGDRGRAPTHERHLRAGRLGRYGATPLPCAAIASASSHFSIPCRRAAYASPRNCGPSSSAEGPRARWIRTRCLNT